MNMVRDKKIKNVGSCEPQGWMEFMLDTCSLDIFGCDENHTTRPRQAVGNAVNLRETSKLATTVRQPVVDYALKHDEFLNSLLYEQTLLRQSSQETDNNTLLSDHSTIGFTSSFSTSNTTLSGDSFSTASSKNSRQHRPVRLKRRLSPGRDGISPLAEHNPKIFDRSRTIELDALPRAEHHPAFYVHPQCRMQKDKGKGEDAGTSICAKGADQCLDKLRAKMKLLTDHALALPGDTKKAPATMKKRNARVFAQYENSLETRSMIELRMGFLSMTYGILLQWDAKKSGKVTLIVLRKNCHESFYPKESKIIPTKLPDLVPEKLRSDAITLSNAIKQPKKGIDVSLLQPPYRMPKPDVRDPVRLYVSVINATGLSLQKNWTVRLTYNDSIENVLLTLNRETKCLTPKAEKHHLKQIIHEKENVPSLSSLNINLLEDQLRRGKNKQRLVATVNVPLSTLECQSSKSAKPRRMRITCPHDPSVAILIEVLLLSDYSYWLRKELESRREEERMYGPRRLGIDDPPSPQTVVDRTPATTSIVENDDDKWDWICCIC